jgi:triosephosphate isomerase
LKREGEQSMRPLIAGNWKMHGTGPQLGEIAAIAAGVRATGPAADILICPPSTLITRAVQAAAGRIAIGGQTCASEVCGAFTGDVSAEMLKDAGAAWVIVGHSERRQHHGETDAMVAAKAKAVWRAGLLAIICIGETEAQRRSGNALTVCADQITGSVPEGITAFGNAIGYEPLWAIGTGHTPTLEEIGQVHSHIRQCLVSALGRPGQAGSDSLRRLREPSKRACGPCGAGSRRRAGRWREPQGHGFRSNCWGGAGPCLRR